MTVFNDLQKDHSGCIVELQLAKIIEDQQIVLFYFGHLSCVGPVSFHHFKFREEFLGIEVLGAVSKLAGLVAEGRYEIRFTNQHRTWFWRNGNVGIGTFAAPYRLTHKLAVLGKGIFTDTLTAPALSVAGNIIARNAVNTIFLNSDVVNNNVTANTYADVTGLSFPVEAGGKYKFKFFIVFNSAATTKGSERNVLAGLTYKVPVLSFESLLPDFKPELEECLSIIEKLYDKAVYNVAVDEKLLFSNFINRDELGKWIETTTIHHFEIVVKTDKTKKPV